MLYYLLYKIFDIDLTQLIGIYIHQSRIVFIFYFCIKNTDIDYTSICKCIHILLFIIFFAWRTTWTTGWNECFGVRGHRFVSTGSQQEFFSPG